MSGQWCDFRHGLYWCDKMLNTGLVYEQNEMGSVGIAFPVLSQVRHPKGGYALVNSFDNKQTCVVAVAGETTNYD